MSTLTDDERKVIELLAKAWDAFITLPFQHPAHKQEFQHAIHAAQRIVMSRVVARQEGWTVPDDYFRPVHPQSRSETSNDGETHGEEQP